MAMDNITISPFEFTAITELEIIRQVGEHACAKISGYISDENAETYRYQLLRNVWVTITAHDENDEQKNIMTGIIAGFALEKQSHIHVLTLELKSGTCLMDGPNHFRTFQNNTLTYMDVLKYLNEQYEGADVLAEACIKNTPIDFLLEYQENDWEFIKRIASRFGLAITPSIVRPGVLYHVGRVQGTSYQLSTDIKYTVNKNIARFMKLGANGTGSYSEQDYSEYVISTRELYGLWDLLTFGHDGGYVYRICSRYQQGELIHTYYLHSLAEMQVQTTFNENQAGCSFPAIIKNVAQDKVQIELPDDENCGQEITCWFPYATVYSSPDGAGWYCMPEIGDRVRLQIPDSREENGYVISAVHMDTPTDRKDPERKSFKNKYGKELIFTPTTLELTNNQGMYIRIADGEGIQIVSSSNINIQSGGTMTLSSDNAMMIAGTESVDIRQGGAGVHLDDDVVFTGGKFRIQ